MTTTPAVRFAPGTLVRARGREWVVLPDSEPDMLVLRPLGGGDDDSAAVLPALEDVTPATFPPPSADDLGDAASASLLRTALRIVSGRRPGRSDPWPTWPSNPAPTSTSPSCWHCGKRRSGSSSPTMSASARPSKRGSSPPNCSPSGRPVLTFDQPMIGQTSLSYGVGRPGMIRRHVQVTRHGVAARGVAVMAQDVARLPPLHDPGHHVVLLAALPGVST